MNKIAVTGDTHGMMSEWDALLQCLKKHAYTTVIIAGDFGFYQNEKLDQLEASGVLVLFVDGNHEAFDALDFYPVVLWQGGLVHELRPHVLHMMRGEVYQLTESETLFTFGGAASLDMPLKKAQGLWSPKEVPTEEELAHARSQLKARGHVDYIVTHTGSHDAIEYVLQGKRKDTDVAFREYELRAFLSEIEMKVDYKQWFFGHYHQDRTLWKNQYTLLRDIRDLRTGALIDTREFTYDFN